MLKPSVTVDPRELRHYVDNMAFFVDPGYVRFAVELPPGLVGKILKCRVPENEVPACTLNPGAGGA